MLGNWHRKVKRFNAVLGEKAQFQVGQAFVLFQLRFPRSRDASLAVALAMKLSEVESRCVGAAAVRCPPRAVCLQSLADCMHEMDLRCAWASTCTLITTRPAEKFVVLKSSRPCLKRLKGQVDEGDY